QGELTHWLDRHSILDLRKHPRTNQDLPRPCFIAEPRSNIGYRADGSIIEASLETDGAERGKPVCNADTETNVVPPPMPILSQCSNGVTHFERHQHSLQRGVFEGNRIIKYDHHTIASVAFKRTAVLNDDLADGRMVVAQESHHIFRV